MLNYVLEVRKTTLKKAKVFAPSWYQKRIFKIEKRPISEKMIITVKAKDEKDMLKKIKKEIGTTLTYVKIKKVKKWINFLKNVIILTD